MIGVIRRKRATESFSGEDDSAQEAEAVEIKNLCAQAAAFAEASSNPGAEGQNCPKYTGIRDGVLAAIDELEQGFCRDFTAFYAIEMCIAANDLSIARKLYRTLTVNYIRSKTEQTYSWIAIAH